MLALRVEFLRVRARALRFGEEVQLLQEEQRRVLKALSGDALEWERRASLATQKECPILRQGAVAYAGRQRHLMLGLENRFRRLWTGVGLAAGGLPAPDIGAADMEDALLADGARLYRMDSDDDDPMVLLKDDASDDEL